MGTPTIKRLPDETSLLVEIERLQQAIQKRAFEISAGGGGGRGSMDDWLQAEREIFWRPPVDFVEKDHSYVLQTAVPGVEANAIDIQVSKGRVMIKAEGSHKHESKNEKVLRCEHTHNLIFRELQLPKDADVEKSSATLENGMLTITFPRVAAVTKKAPAPREVAVGSNPRA